MIICITLRANTSISPNPTLNDLGGLGLHVCVSVKQGTAEWPDLLCHILTEMGVKPRISVSHKHCGDDRNNVKDTINTAGGKLKETGVANAKHVARQDDTAVPRQTNKQTNNASRLCFI